MCCRSPTIHCQYFLHFAQYTIAPCLCSVRTLLCAYSARVLANLQGIGYYISKSVRTTAVVWQPVVTASGFRYLSAVLTQYHVLLLHGCTPTSVQRCAPLRVVAVRTSPRARPCGLKSCLPTFAQQALTVCWPPCVLSLSPCQRVRVHVLNALRPCVRVLCTY